MFEMIFARDTASDIDRQLKILVDISIMRNYDSYEEYITFSISGYLLAAASIGPMLAMVQ